MQTEDWVRVRGAYLEARLAHEETPEGTECWHLSTGEVIELDLCTGEVKVDDVVVGSAKRGDEPRAAPLTSDERDWARSEFIDACCLVDCDCIVDIEVGPGRVVRAHTGTGKYAFDGRVLGGDLSRR
jgi:hypothetical protein